MIRRFALALLAALALSPLSAQANLYFTEQPASSTGAFEWDVFDLLGEVGYAGPHSPDVRSTGVGAAAITATSTAASFPLSAVTSTNNLYTGTGIGSFNVNLTGAAAVAPQSTLVLQVSAFGPLNSSSFLLNGSQAPTEFVSRGTAPNGANYYWAEWQAPAAAAFALGFSGAAPHLSVSGVQLDYFNSVDPVNAVAAPVFVPEPTAALMAGLGLISIGAAAKRRRA